MDINTLSKIDVDAFYGIEIEEFPACTCSQKAKCTTGKERRIKRWEHEAVLEKVQARLDGDPGMMRIRRQTVEHPLERSSRGWDQPTSR